MNFDFSVLTFDDIFYAAVGALLLTWIIKFIIKINKLIKNPMTGNRRIQSSHMIFQL